MGLFLPAAPGLLDLLIALSCVLPEHTTDLGFPRSALLSSSCQYTMVPLGGLPGHRAIGQPYLSGTNGRACANGVHVNRACPVAAVGYPGMKPQQHCPGELQQVTWLWEQRGHTGMGCHWGGRAASWDFFPPRLNPGLLDQERESYLDSDVTFSSLFEQQEDVNSVLRQTFLGNGYDSHSPQMPRYPSLPLLSPRARFLPGSPSLA